MAQAIALCFFLFISFTLAHGHLSSRHLLQTSSPPPPSPPPPPPPSPPPPSPPPPPPSKQVCFPGDALVQVMNGDKKAMRDLEVGDKVAVLSEDGKILYGDIYAFGHKDPNTFSEFLRIRLKSRNISSTHYVLELTTLHFVPIMEDEHQGLKYKRAQDIRIGDKMWSMGNSSLEVTDISRVWKQGLYNPLTMDGTIMVNDVLASVHSEWFLDRIFDAFGITSSLPLAYQVILTPLRAMYCILGKDNYVSIYNWVNLMVDVASFGTRYGGIMAFATATVAGFVSTIMISNYNTRE